MSGRRSIRPRPNFAFRSSGLSAAQAQTIWEALRQGVCVCVCVSVSVCVCVCVYM